MAVPERIYPAIPQIIGGGRILPSPSQFYVTGEDRLRVVTASSIVGAGVKIQWRMATLKGDTVPNSQDHTPNSDRSVKVQDFELGDGSLLNVTAFASAGAIRTGQLYVMIQLVRGRGLAAIVLGTILGGYVTTTQALGFPGSPIVGSLEGGGCPRTISGTDPAAGVEQLETVPTGARWELKAWFGRLVCSATVATRQPTLVLNYSTNNIQIGFPTSAAASQTQNWMAAQGMPLSTKIGAASDLCGLPIGMQLIAGNSFGTSTTGLQVGDDWGAPVYNVNEWLEVL
jgi:hypothetical protein